MLTIKGGFWRLLLIVALYLSACLLPFAGMLLVVTLPAMMFLLSFYNGWTKTMNAFFVAIVVIFIILSFTHTYYPLLMLAAVGLSGMVMARSIRLNPPIEVLVLFPSLVCLAAITAFFVLSGFQLEMKAVEVIKKYLGDAVDLNISFYTRLPLKPEEIKAIQDSRDGVVELLARIFPAICVIPVLSVIWLNVLLIGRIIGKKSITPPVFSGLSRWRTPVWLVWVFIASGGMMILSHTHLMFAGINIFLIAAFLYFLQGLAIISFFFQSKNVSMFLRVIIYFLIAIQQLLMIAIALVGLFDLWVDFRKFFRKDQATS